MQQSTKKFLSLHFTHDITGLTHDIITAFSHQKCRNGANVTASQKVSQPDREGNPWSL